MKERFIVIEQSTCDFSGEINANPVSFEGKEVFETELEADQATKARIIEVIDDFRQAYDWDWEQVILKIIKGDMILTKNYVGGGSLTAQHLFKTHKIKGDQEMKGNQEMKDYYMEVTVQYAVSVQADSVEAAKEQVKEQFYEDFGITLLDEEIKEILK